MALRPIRRMKQLLSVLLIDTRVKTGTQDQSKTPELESVALYHQATRWRSNDIISGQHSPLIVVCLPVTVKTPDGQSKFSPSGAAG